MKRKIISFGLFFALFWPLALPGVELTLPSFQTSPLSELRLNLTRSLDYMIESEILISSLQKELDGLHITLAKQEEVSLEQSARLLSLSTYLTESRQNFIELSQNFNALYLEYQREMARRELLQRILLGFTILCLILIGFRIKRTVMLARSGQLTLMRLVDVWL